MMTSNVQITPDTSQAVNILANSGQQRQQIDQMKLAEIGRNKAYFQDMVAKSFASGSAGVQEKYKEMQDEFITKASDVWKRGDGFLSMDDHLKLQQLKKPLDNYVAKYNDIQDMYSKELLRISSNPDKIDQKKSYEKLQEIISGIDDDVDATWKKIQNPANYTVFKPEDFKFQIEANRAADAAWEAVPGTETGELDANGDPIFGKRVFNEPKFDFITEKVWEENKDNLIALNPKYKNKKSFIEDQKQRAKKYGAYTSPGSRNSEAKKWSELEEFTDPATKLPTFDIPESKRIKSNLNKGLKIYETPGGKSVDFEGGDVDYVNIVRKNGKKYIGVRTKKTEGMMAKFNNFGVDKLGDNNYATVYIEYDPARDDQKFEGAKIKFKDSKSTNKSFGNAEELGL